MPTKLSLKFKNGKSVLVADEVPDIDEAKRLWKEGKSAQFIIEKAKNDRKGRKTD